MTNRSAASWWSWATSRSAAREKTPVVETFARALRDRGRKVAILSRGYKSRPARFWWKWWYALSHTQEPPPRVVSDGERVLLDSEEAGDEPYMLARNLPGVVVLVDKNRVKSGTYAIKRFGCDTLVLDDGFQYLHLKGSLNLLLVDKTNPFGNGRLLPRGILREPIKHLRRANYVFLTKSNGQRDAELEALIAAHNPDADIIECAHRPQYLQRCEPDSSARPAPRAPLLAERAPRLRLQRHRHAGKLRADSAGPGSADHGPGAFPRPLSLYPGGSGRAVCPRRNAKARSASSRPKRTRSGFPRSPTARCRSTISDLRLKLSAGPPIFRRRSAGSAFRPAGRAFAAAPPGATPPDPLPNHDHLPPFQETRRGPGGFFHRPEARRTRPDRRLRRARRHGYRPGWAARRRGRCPTSRSTGRESPGNWRWAPRERQMAALAEIELARMRTMEAYIALRGSENIFEPSDVPAAKMQLVSRLMKPVLDYRVGWTKWVALRWPTAAMAQQGPDEHRSL